MTERRVRPYYIPSISLGNVLTLLGVIGVIVGVIFGAGQWVKGIQDRLDSHTLMIKHVGQRLDDVDATLASINAKLGTVQHASAVPASMDVRP